MSLADLHMPILFLAGITLIYAGISDARSFRIPNIACLILLLLFPLFVLSAPHEIPWQKHLMIFAFVFSFGYALYVKKFAGAGDIKLVSVLSLWAGPSFFGSFIIFMALAGGVLSIGVGIDAYIKHRRQKTEEKFKLFNTPIPYGVAIAASGLCVLALLSHPDLLVKV